VKQFGDPTVGSFILHISYWPTRVYKLAPINIVVGGTNHRDHNKLSSIKKYFVLRCRIFHDLNFSCYF
jgi:hypothetical protein